MKISSFSQYKDEFSSLFLYYPDFIIKNAVLNVENEIPVFIYHTIEPEVFEEQLKYLSKNRYTTLSIEDYYECITGKKKIPNNSILLTIDDGRLSFWKYGFPLLKKYGFKATLFVIPGRILESKIVRENMVDVWNDKISFDNLSQIDTNDIEYCNWEEIRIMKNSNLIDIESHTLFHKIVFVEPKLVDIIDTNTTLSMIAAYFSDNEIGKKIKKEDYFGLPLFKNSSLMEGKSCFTISNKLKQYFQGQFRDQIRKGESKQKILRNFIRHFDKMDLDNELKIIKNGGIEKLIENDILTASSLIKEKIGEHSGDHFCLPYTLGSELTINLLKKNNIKTCFWGILKEKKNNMPGDDPYFNCRIKNDFIFRLPGEGRKSLFKIYFDKIIRRFKGNPIY